MASTFQNRLVGTVIVVALAVIFLPNILDGKKHDNPALTMQIPSKPSLQRFTYQQDFSVTDIKTGSGREIEIVSEQAVDGEVTEDGKTPAVILETENAAIDALLADNTVATSAINMDNFPTADVPSIESANKSWVIQLGSFKHAENVRDLLNKLNRSGYRAFTNKVRTSSGDLTKVFVGPDLNKQKLQDSIPHLNELTGLKGRLTEFDVQ